MLMQRTMRVWEGARAEPGVRRSSGQRPRAMAGEHSPAPGRLGLRLPAVLGWDLGSLQGCNLGPCQLLEPGFLPPCPSCSPGCPQHTRDLRLGPLHSLGPTPRPPAYLPLCGSSKPRHQQLPRAVIPDATCYPRCGALRSGAHILSVFLRNCQLQGTEASPGSRPRAQHRVWHMARGPRCQVGTKWVQRLSTLRNTGRHRCRCGLGAAAPGSWGLRPKQPQSPACVSQCPCVPVASSAAGVLAGNRTPPGVPQNFGAPQLWQEAPGGPAWRGYTLSMLAARARSDGDCHPPARPNLSLWSPTSFLRPQTGGPASLARGRGIEGRGGRSGLQMKKFSRFGSE